MKPELYHSHHNLYKDDLAFWHDLTAQFGQPVLELGCGTGRVLLPLRQQGINVIGLDLEPAMLAVLKTQDPAAPVLAADLRQFHFSTLFPLILLPCNTWSIFTAPQRQAALNTITRHLTPGGCFCVSLPNPAILIDLGDSDDIEIEDTFPHPQTGNPVQVSSTWETRDEHITVFWHYDHLLPDGQIERTTHHISHQLDQTETYLNELHAAGFEITTWGDFDRSLYDEDSPSLIVQAVKH